MAGLVAKNHELCLNATTKDQWAGLPTFIH